MKRWLLSLTVVLVSVGMATADDKAEAVVKKAIEAHGGAEALNKYLAGKSKMKGELSLLGMSIEFTGSVMYMLPDRYKFELSASIAGQKLTILQTAKGDKIKSTVKVGDMTVPTPEDDKDDVKMAMILQDAERFTPLLDKKKFTLKSADDEEVDGKKTSVIVATPAAVKKEVRFYFDKTTGLLLRRSHQSKGPGDDGAPKEVLEDSYSSDYKKVKGIMVPHKLEVKHDGKKFMTATVSDVDLLEKLEDKEFGSDD